MTFACRRSSELSFCHTLVWQAEYICQLAWSDGPVVERLSMKPLSTYLRLVFTIIDFFCALRGGCERQLRWEFEGAWFL